LLLPDLGEIHDQYLALARLAREGGTLGGERNEGLGGRLLLRVGLDTEGISVLIAAGLAGAAALCVDPEPELLREGLRHGLCDFLVADLSEALRILKNETRRGRAVSVSVAEEPEALLAEMAERGVQPDLLSVESDGPSGADLFRDRGAIAVPAAEADFETEQLVWSVAADAPRILPQLAQMAAAALDERREDTPARQRWLADAPRRLGRSWAGRQCLRMAANEAKVFTDRARAEFSAVSISLEGRQR
jgi:hypothetical protein